MTDALDNLCDSCKSPMTIKRNAKGSRYLSCQNTECPRVSRRNAKKARTHTTKVRAVVKPQPTTPQPKDKAHVPAGPATQRKPFFSFGNR